MKRMEDIKTIEDIQNLTEDEYDSLMASGSPLPVIYALWASAKENWFPVGPQMETKLEEWSEAGYEGLEINRRRAGIGPNSVQFQIKIRDLNPKK